MVFIVISRCKLYRSSAGEEIADDFNT